MKGIIHGFLLTLSGLWMLFLFFMFCKSVFSVDPYHFGWFQAGLTCIAQFYLVMFGYVNMTK